MGNIILKGAYKNGKKNGLWKTYENENILKEEMFPRY